MYRDKEWLETFLEDHPNETKERKPLNVGSISGAIYILFVCHILSTIVFACEMIFDWAISRTITV